MTDGDDNSSRHSYRDVLDLLRAENVAVYVVGFFATDAKYLSLLGEGELQARLTQLAEVTGGKAYFPRTMKECDQACIAIAKELRQQYGLGYYPEPKPRDGSWHTDQVQLQLSADVSRKGLTARTRAGSFAPRE